MFGIRVCLMLRTQKLKFEIFNFERCHAVCWLCSSKRLFECFLFCACLFGFFFLFFFFLLDNPSCFFSKKNIWIYSKIKFLRLGCIQLSMFMSFKIKGFTIDAISIQKWLYFYIYFSNKFSMRCKLAD